jgi:hypothetical protein
MRRFMRVSHTLKTNKLVVGGSMKLITVALLVLGLAGCASGYRQFYTVVPGATPEVIAKIRVTPPPERPLIEHSPTFPPPDVYLRRSYIAIGYSSFNSGHKESEKNAIAQGQKVGADLVVIVNPSFTGSVTSQIPITTPTTETSYTSGTATAYGSGGSATAYGNSTTTTYGTRTNYIPMTVNRFDYGAVYFVKRSFVFGALWRDLSNEERAVLQSNSGVYVTSVVNDTPAFRNDVLAGDIIVKIDGQLIYGQQAASDALTNKRGQDVGLTIFRNGQFIEKHVKLAQ